MSPAKRKELVSELTSFYEFLVSLHLPPDALKSPPSNGWPGIDQGQLGYLNKDDDAIDILRHIPYIRQDQNTNPYQIYENCVCNDFTGTFFQRSSKEYKNADSTEPIVEEIDSCVVTLARSASRDGYYIFYNTATHTLELVDYQDGEHRERGIKEFFEMLKTEYRELSVFPTEPESVWMAKRGDPEHMKQLQELFRRHGWPSGDYRKQECLRAAKELFDAL